jgi:hypothetical protein
MTDSSTNTSATVPTCFFLTDGKSYVPTRLATGPWGPSISGNYIGLAAVTHYSHAGVATGVARLFDETGPIGSGMTTAVANPGFTPPRLIVSP